jgi:hypothetical protein
VLLVCLSNWQKSRNCLPQKRLLHRLKRLLRQFRRSLRLRPLLNSLLPLPRRLLNSRLLLLLLLSRPLLPLPQK